jgi:hypothetical protein
MSGRLYANLLAASTMAAMLAIAGCHDDNGTPGTTPGTTLGTPPGTPRSSPDEVTLTATSGGLSIPGVVPPSGVSSVSIDMKCGIPGFSCTTTTLPSSETLSMSETGPVPEPTSGG